MYSVCIASHCLFNHEQGVRWNFNDEFPVTSPSPSIFLFLFFKARLPTWPFRTNGILMSSCRYALYIFYFHNICALYRLRLTSVARHFVSDQMMMRSVAENRSRSGHSTCPRLQIWMAICLEWGVGFFLRLGIYFSSCLFTAIVVRCWMPPLCTGL